MKIGYFSPARGIYFRCVRCTCHSYTVLGGNESAQQPRKIHDKLPKTFVEIIFAFLRGFNVEMWQIRWILENSFRIKQKLILFFLGNYSFPFSTRDAETHIRLRHEERANHYYMFTQWARQKVKNALSAWFIWLFIFSDTIFGFTKLMQYSIFKLKLLTIFG